MKASTAIFSVILVTVSLTALVQWTKASRLQADFDALNAQIKKQSEETASRGKEQTDDLKRQLQRRDSELAELLRLRSELNQLHKTTNDLASLQAQNQQLLNAAEQLQDVVQKLNQATNSTDLILRENWSFEGYGSPESALISAIWAMREGKPQVYLDSLTGDEQARMAKLWQEQTEAAIIAKHQSDVSKITGLRFLDEQTVSPTEVIITVYSQGSGRVDQADMINTADGWKFSGFTQAKK